MDRVQRRRLIGARLTVTLTIAVAVLSIITGIANIGARELVGPIAEYIPQAIQRTAGFTGVLTGFLMLASAFGLKRRLRVAFHTTAVLLPLTAIQGFVQASPLSIPLILLSVIAMPNLIVNRARFNRRLSISTSQLAAGLALIGALAYGTVGAYALRTEFSGIETLLDAFYFTLVTASTVGYGDVVAQTQMARFFGLSVLVVGTASFAIALGSLLGPTIEARFSSALGKMTTSEIESLENHIMVLGYGELTEPILTELERHVEFVVITDDSDRATMLINRGFKVLTADPSDEATLKRAKIDTARAVVIATNNDADDALTVITVRQLDPGIRIVAAATDTENVIKLKRAGADTVISPATIGGRLLVQSALGRKGIEELADRIFVGDNDL